jgi:hypothetical protein
MTPAFAEPPSRIVCIGVKHLVVALLLNWHFVPRISHFVAPLARAAGAAVFAFTAAGCNSLYTAPTAAVPTTSQFNTAIVPLGGSTLSTFTLSATTTVGVTLVSVISNVTGNVLEPAMNLVLGTPIGATTCRAVTGKTVTPALAAQIQQSLAAGTYCVQITDAGLAEPGVVTVRINSSSTGPTNIPTPANTDIFSSTLGAQGSATHQLALFYNGTATLSLASAGTASTIGVGLGAWDGQVCRLNAAVATTASLNPLFILPVDPGNYCVRVWDIGLLTAPILFTVDTLHP